MARYTNGDIPDHLLIRRGNFLLTAGTWAKWDALVADILARFGVRLEITDGLGVLRGTGAYRTRLMQRLVKAHFASIGQGRMAAAEGTSSHGGEFEGRDALAIDVNNYARIPLAEFYAAARRAGLEPGYFDGRGGRPYEPWHLIDREPYRAVPATAGDNSQPIPEEEIMNAAQEAKLDQKLDQLARDVAWLKDRIGGKAGNTSITDRLRALAPVVSTVQWIKDRIGGSTKTAPPVTDELRNARTHDRS